MFTYKLLKPVCGTCEAQSCGEGSSHTSQVQTVLKSSGQYLGHPQAVLDLTDYGAHYNGCIEIQDE